MTIKQKKIILEIYDLQYNLIESKAYIDYQTIQTRLYLKISSLAIVYASKKIMDNTPYFRYYLITIYKLKSFNKFIELLNKK